MTGLAKDSVTGMEHFYALILAGGGGTRLWPLSREATPKQMLTLFGDQSMFRAGVTRLLPLFEQSQIYVATAEQYEQALKAESPEIPDDNFIIEPYARNNAAAVGLALSIIQKRDPDAVIALLTADHYIGLPDRFRAVLTAAYEIARDEQIVTLGITPTFPATGYGYIQQGDALGEANGFSYLRATRFTEKPNLVEATQFLASGRYSWNSGMFIMSARQAMAEFERQQPEMHGLFQQLHPTIGTSAFGETLHAIWDQMPKLSIDYAIMEDAKRMVVIPVDIGWNDVGSWATLFDLLDQDRLGNCGKKPTEERIVLDTKRSLFYTDKFAVAIGVEDLIVVEHEDVLMICHRDRAQDVREIVKYLREHDMKELL